MAKKAKNSEPVVPVVPVEETLVPAIEPTSEIAEEVVSEQPVIEEAQVEPVTQFVDDKIQYIVKDEPVKEKTIKETFDEAISKPPFVIYQNGIVICHSNAHLVIKTEAKYFEINSKKYSYAGIEVKHQ